jgi:hypothetical protein
VRNCYSHCITYQVAGFLNKNTTDYYCNLSHILQPSFLKIVRRHQSINVKKTILKYSIQVVKMGVHCKYQINFKELIKRKQELINLISEPRKLS